MLEKGGDTFVIPREGEKAGEEEKKLEFEPYEDESGYKFNGEAFNQQRFDEGREQLLFLQRLKAKEIGKRTKRLV